MAPRIDAEHRLLELSVADLLEARLLRSLGFGNRGGYERMWLGQAIHSRYQEQALAADPTYRREVSLVLELEVRDWKVRIHGRADGLRRGADGEWVVEEIKSVRRDRQLSAATRELYQRQALLYCWMLSRLEEGPIRAELILIEIGSDALERIPIESSFDEVEAGIFRRINGLLRSHRQQEEARRSRRESADAMRFPFPELRPGQDEILAAVETALDHGDHLLLEATTGIGKTVATLYPALRHCLRHGKRLYVLTAKTLQQEMVSTVLAMLDQHRAFHALRLRAKAKMCANDQLICHEEYCSYARDYYVKMESSKVVDRLREQHQGLDPDAIFQAARDAEVCPFEVSLELGSRAQVTVCDYNYAFAPYVALTEFAEDGDLSDTVLVIDEIHNLVGRGRGYYSPELAASRARRAADQMSLRGATVHRDIERACRKLATLIENTVEETLGEAGERTGGGERALETTLPEDALWALRPAFDTAFVDYLEYQRETHSFSPEDPFVELYFDLLRFLNALVVSDSAFSHCVERRGDGPWLKILCKDPSRFLGAVVNRCHTVIGLSATLSPSEFYRDLLGFDPERTATTSLPNPFPPTKRKLVIDAAVATTWRKRPQNYPRIAERLAAFADAVPGNCLALFPSYNFLAEIAGRMRSETKRVFVQQRADGDRQREEILETLRSALFGDVFLLAVAGGVFAEGVDYPGDMLKAVAIVGPCLPAVSLEQRLLQDYYDERFERGFEYAFVVPGMTRVVQAAGRLIRSPEDSGVIVLMDQRFLHKPYRTHLPGDWLPEEGPKALVSLPATAARDFFLAPPVPADPEEE